jgi:transcriptional regulator with XRE-family HTH domain
VKAQSIVIGVVSVGGMGGAVEHHEQAELISALRVQRQKFRDARERAGVSLLDMARSTNISLAALEALDSGRLHKVPHGVSVFAYLKGVSKTLDLDLSEVHQEYQRLFCRTAGLPPAPARTRWQRLSGLWCKTTSHRAYERHFHPGTDSPFHWTYKQCNRCGDVSIMWAEHCFGRKVRAKFDVDSPVTERVTCDIRLDSWFSSSLKAPFESPNKSWDSIANVDPATLMVTHHSHRNSRGK